MAARHKKTASFLGAHRLALLAAIVVGASGLGASSPETPTASESAPTAAATAPDRAGDQDWRVSRSTVRSSLESKSPGEFHGADAPEAKPEELQRKFVTTDLNVRPSPRDGGKVLTVLSTGDTVKATGVTDGPWAEISRSGEYRWVKADYLSDADPDAESGTTSGGSDSGGGISGAPCDSGSEVEEGLTPDAISVHRAVCAEFPEVSTYGGLRADSDEHGSGQALDIMVSDSSLGDEISEWVRGHAGELGASEVIWSQKIWTVQRSSEGWRPMPDRGSATANHYDHVHVTVYGSSGG